MQVNQVYGWVSEDCLAGVKLVEFGLSKLYQPGGADVLLDIMTHTRFNRTVPHNSRSVKGQSGFRGRRHAKCSVIQLLPMLLSRPGAGQGMGRRLH